LATLHLSCPTAKHQSQTNLKTDSHQIIDAERKMTTCITAIQIFSKIRKNTVLIGSLTRDVEKEYHDVLRFSVTCRYTKLFQIQFSLSE